MGSKEHEALKAAVEAHAKVLLTPRYVPDTEHESDTHDIKPSALR